MTRRGATEREQLDRAGVVAVAHEDFAALQRMTGPELARNMPCSMAALPAHAAGASLGSGARGGSRSWPRAGSRSGPSPASRNWTHMKGAVRPTESLAEPGSPPDR